jgi:hypothetical protein
MEEQTVKNVPERTFILVPVYFQGYKLLDFKGEVEIRGQPPDARISLNHFLKLEPSIRKKIEELYTIPPNHHIGIKYTDNPTDLLTGIEYMVYRVDYPDRFQFNESDRVPIPVHVNMKMNKKGGGANRSRRAQRKARRSRSHRRT